MPSAHLADLVHEAPSLPRAALRIGIDLVHVGAVERSLSDFGARFSDRLFAPGELRDSTVAGRLDARRLALRFAAKEATIKAFDLGAIGLGWSQIEVIADAPAAGRVRLHGRAAAAAAGAGSYEIAVSWSHDGDVACAIVVAVPAADAGTAGGAPAGASRDELRYGVGAADIYNEEQN